MLLKILTQCHKTAVRSRNKNLVQHVGSDIRDISYSVSNVHTQRLVPHTTVDNGCPVST